MIKLSSERTRRVDGHPRYSGETHGGELVYVVEIDIGALPNDATNLVPHGLTFGAIVDVIGTATNGAITVSMD